VAYVSMSRKANHIVLSPPKEKGGIRLAKTESKTKKKRSKCGPENSQNTDLLFSRAKGGDKSWRASVDFELG